MKIVNVNTPTDPDAERLRLDVPMIQFDPWPFRQDAVATKYTEYVNSDGDIENEYPGNQACINSYEHNLLGFTTEGRWIPVSSKFVAILGVSDEA